jgi:hypothetical protein
MVPSLLFSMVFTTLKRLCDHPVKFRCRLCENPVKNMTRIRASHDSRKPHSEHR